MGFVSELIDGNQKAKASRLSFGEALARLGAEHPEIVVLDADLSKSTQTQLFGEKFPERFFNMGIAEANMIGAAAGLAMQGFVPFAASFGCFLTGRYDQIRMSISASKANVRIVGTHAGVGIGEDGHSQMALEDLALMRCLPNMTVIQPADDWDTNRAIEWSLKHNGPVYLRLTRQNLPALKRPAGAVFQPGRWDILNPAVLDSGFDVALLGSGGIMQPTLEAADILAGKGLKVLIVNAAWIRPLDESALAKIAAKKPRLVATVEDHYTTGGLGGAVAEVLTQLPSSPQLLRIGVTEFGQSGSPKDNLEYYGFTGNGISQKVLKALSLL
jgi:transketolase